MPDVDLRLLRYFAAVVDEGSLTRAARRLRITQPALSRAVRSLERSIGTALLLRSPQGTTPTAAGRLLLEGARDLQCRADAVVQRARAVGGRPPRLRLTVGACDAAVAAELVAATAGDDAELVVEVVSDGATAQVASLHAAASDVALVRTPFDTAGLDTSQLWIEPRVVVVCNTHPVADRERVDLAALHQEPVTVFPGMGERARQYWAAGDVDHHTWTAGPTVTSPTDVLAAVRLGQAVAFIAASHAAECLLPGLSVRAVHGLSPSALHMAWSTRSTSLRVARFVASTGEVARRGPLPGHLVASSVATRSPPPPEL